MQGRNRAQVWQHCSGHEHRRRWKSGDIGLLAVPVAIDSAQGSNQSGALQTGTCEGLVLGGELAQTTRLGGDLLEVWLKYAKFANLERLGSWTKSNIKQLYNAL